MRNKYKKMYKVTLFMIDNNKIVNLDMDKIEDIADIMAFAPTKPVLDIIVYKSMFKFREIITNMDIPGLEGYRDSYQSNYRNYVLTSLKPLCFMLEGYRDSYQSNYRNYVLTSLKPLCFMYSKASAKEELKSAYTLLDDMLVKPEELEKYINDVLNADNNSINNVKPKILYRNKLESYFKKAEDEFIKFTNYHNIYTDDMKKIDAVKRKSIIKKYHF